MTEQSVEQSEAPAVSEVETIRVDYAAVLNRVTRHYAEENSRLVAQLAMSGEENAELRQMRAALQAEVQQLRARLAMAEGAA